MAEESYPIIGPPIDLVYPLYRQNEVRYWLNFICRRYSNRRQDKARGGVGPPLVDVKVPMPTNMLSSTQISYEPGKSNETPFIEAFRNGGIMNALKSFGNMVTDFIGDLTVGGHFGRVDMDKQENLFSEATPRVFSFSFAFISRNASEAASIARIAKAFDAYAHPFPDGLSFFGDGSNARQTHPPLWQWRPYTREFSGATKSAENNPGLLYWTSQPQTSVLTNVTIDKTPMNGIFAASNDLPIATTLNLTFAELEPNLNLLGDIASRSIVTGNFSNNAGGAPGTSVSNYFAPEAFGFNRRNY